VLAEEVSGSLSYARLLGLAPGATYELAVQTCDGRGCGPLSQPVRLRTGGAGIQEPYAINAGPGAAGEIVISWRQDDPDATAFVELSSPRAEPVGPPVEITHGLTSYVFGGISPLTSYTVRVQLCRENGCSVHSAEQTVTVPSSLEAADLRGAIPFDPIRVSMVEGIAEPMELGDAGSAIRASYQNDRVTIDLDSTTGPRFLVLNELYHPGWRAFAGEIELPILPTNTVMRGVMVPPGVTRIEMRFVPFSRGWVALLCLLLGLIVAVAGCSGLRQLDVPRQ